MRLPISIILPLLDICLAQNWNHNACIDISYELEAAMAEAITMARTANDVLINHFATDEKVQQMVKWVLGDDASLPDNVAKAQGYFQGVMKYETFRYPYLTPQSGKNKDLLIFCEDINYEEAGEFTRNKAIGDPIHPQAWDAVKLCYNKVVRAGDFEQLSMALTMRSEMTDYSRYQPVLDAWKASGSVGNEPDRADYATPQPNKVNTMDICSWYIEELIEIGFRKVDKNTIAIIQDLGFIAEVKGDRRAFDTLSTTLGGTMLHELSHTELAGRTRDTAAKAGCYGWKCVGDLQDVENADSINILGVALTIWKMGFYVDNDGTVKNL